MPCEADQNAKWQILKRKFTPLGPKIGRTLIHKWADDDHLSPKINEDQTLKEVITIIELELSENTTITSLPFQSHNWETRFLKFFREEKTSFPDDESRNTTERYREKIESIAFLVLQRKYRINGGGKHFLSQRSLHKDKMKSRKCYLPPRYASYSELSELKRPVVLISCFHFLFWVYLPLV